MRSDLKQAAEFLRNNDNFIIAGHINPDGDCLGTMSGLALSLRKIGKTVCPVVPDGVPDIYKFLPDTDTFKTEPPEDPSAYVAIMVDCENFERLGTLTETFKKCRSVLEIDHHPGTEGRYANVSLVDPTAAACGELVFALVKEAGIEVTKEIADCFMTAVITDTGSFRFSNVTPDTLRSAADLLESGASVSRISQRVYEARSLSSLKLLGRTLSNMQITGNGKIAYATVSRADIADTNGTETETEGLVNYIRSVKGVSIAILFREETDGNTKVSLRSRDGSDISQIARMFGGGGHRAAAGCTVDRPINEAVEIVIDAVRKWMGY